MTVNPISVSTDQRNQPISLQEWVRLRRHPRPEFFSTLQDVPEALLSIAQPWLPPAMPMQGALVLPGEYYARKKMHWEWTPERGLIFLNGAALYVINATAQAPARAAMLDAQALLYIRSSLLLLYGLLEFRADCGGDAGEVRLEYNTVIWEALRSSLFRFVDAATSGAAPADEAEVKARNAAIIKALPFKFANGVRYYTLVPGELLHAAVFQPAIWRRRGILPQEVTPNTLFALTDRKVVLIEETRSLGWFRWRADNEYGWIFTYIPRNRVAAMTVTEGAAWTELRVALEWGGAKDERTFLLEPSVAAKWAAAWRAG